MCTRISCRKCGKPSWAGCGAHVEQVLGDVRPVDRCRCREEAARERQARRAAGSSKKSWLSRLLGN